MTFHLVAVADAVQTIVCLPSIPLLKRSLVTVWPAHIAQTAVPAMETMHVYTKKTELSSVKQRRQCKSVRL